MECVTPRRARSIRHDTATTPRTKDSCSEPSTTHSSKDPDNALPDDRLPRMHLSTPKHNFELLASRTISQALSDDSRAAKPLPSPLDTVDSSLYPRFPRFSLTTESRLPDLSTDDVTSTKISLDEEGMVASRRPSNTSDSRSSRRQKLWIALHRAVSSPTFGIRRLGDRIRRVPAIMLSGGNSKRLDAEGSESQVQVSLASHQCTGWSAKYLGCCVRHWQKHVHRTFAIVIDISKTSPEGTVFQMVRSSSDLFSW
jgi:hypothetical protein